MLLYFKKKVIKYQPPDPCKKVCKEVIYTLYAIFKIDKKNTGSLYGKTEIVISMGFNFIHK